MLDTIFSSATTASEVSILPLLACTLACLVYGGGLACVYGHAGHRSASFMMALAVLPAIVCIVIALVNGNVGAGVAVAGTFSLVRFRSAPGTGRNIAFVFLAMAIGLVAGMGYVALAGIVTLILGGAFFVLQEIAARRGDSRERMLRITVPEDLDYMDAFGRRSGPEHLPLRARGGQDHEHGQPLQADLPGEHTARGERKAADRCNTGAQWQSRGFPFP